MVEIRAEWGNLDFSAQCNDNQSSLTSISIGFATVLIIWTTLLTTWLELTLLLGLRHQGILRCQIQRKEAIYTNICGYLTLDSI